MKIDNMVFRYGLFGMTPAMEAPEDLTATTNDAMRRSGTRNRQPSDFEPPTTSNETRQENASGAGNNDGNISSDIDSITPENASGGPADNANPNNEGNAPNDGGGGDAGGDELGLDDGMAADDGMNDDGSGGGDDMGGGDFGGSDDGMGGDDTPPESPEDAIRIRRLQDIMNQFYIVLCNTCDSMTRTVIPSADEDLQKIYASSTANLNAAKAMLLDLLTTKFTPGNYAYKLRKYLALRHLYSVVLEIIEMHSDAIDAQRTSGQK